jgi:hypothetical protein
MAPHAGIPQRIKGEYMTGRLHNFILLDLHSPLGYSDYDVFLEMIEVHEYIGVKSYSKTLL